LKGLLESLQDSRSREAARLIERHQNLISESVETPPPFLSGNRRAAGD